MMIRHNDNPLQRYALLIFLWASTASFVAGGGCFLGIDELCPYRIFTPSFSLSTSSNFASQQIRVPSLISNAAGTLRVCRWYAPPQGWRGRNFGDELGPVVVRLLASQFAPRVKVKSVNPVTTKDPCLWALGTVAGIIRPGDIVWGIGARNNKSSQDCPPAGVPIAAVRGPITRAHFIRLCNRTEEQVPAIYGDPALLLPHLDPSLRLPKERRELPCAIAHGSSADKMIADLKGTWLIVDGSGDRNGSIVLNGTFTNSTFYDQPNLQLDGVFIDPRQPWKPVLSAIQLNCATVYSSSLHGIIVAESLGIPARFVRYPPMDVTEGFKYADYYAASGRIGEGVAGNLEEAMKMGPRELPDPDVPDLEELVDSFPWELVVERLLDAEEWE